MIRTCTKCKEKKVTSEFFKDRTTKSGFGSNCKSCHTTSVVKWHTKNNKRWREANPDKAKENYNRWHENNKWYRKEKHKASRRFHLKKTFGISEEQYNILLKVQNGKCAICKKPPNHFNLAVDHCHETGKIRGLLHSKCNAAIGLLEDNPKLLKAALDYLSDR